VCEQLDLLTALDARIKSIVVAQLEDACPRSKYVSGDKVCEGIGIEPRTLKTWRDGHGLPYRRLGKVCLYDLEEVERWVEERAVRRR
jgi:Helix-turn-helix domain